jgi:hypothetical protein
MKIVWKSLACVLVLCFALPAFAGSIKEYSTDVVDVKSGKVLGTYYVAEKKKRIDVLVEKTKGSFIARMDQRKAFSLVPEEKLCILIPFHDDMPSDSSAMMGMAMMGWTPPEYKSEKLGSETVNGYLTEKFKITSTGSVQGKPYTRTEYVWKAEEFDCPHPRMQDAEGVVMEMRNIKVGPQAASLFEIPAGYMVMDMSRQMEGMSRQMKEMMNPQPDKK